MRLVNVNVKGDWDQKSEPWKKYGYAEIPIQNLDAEGNFAGPAGFKSEVKSEAGREPFVRCSIPAGMAFVPFEAIDDLIVSSLEKRMNDAFPELKKTNFAIESVTEKLSHGGNTKHWLVRTNVPGKVENSYAGKDDALKLGFCVRNGYNTGTSLGIDVFTFRLVCSNGAFAKGTDLAKTSVRHVGDPKALLAQFQTGLMTVVEEWAEILKVYNRMARTMLTEKIANEIYEATRHGWDINSRFFPEYYAIDEDNRLKKKQVVSLTNEGKSVTMWENFNDMTYGLWRAQDEQRYTNEKGKELTRKAMAFDGMVSRERKLHEVVKAALYSE